MNFEKNDRVVMKHIYPISGRQGTVVDVKGSSLVVLLDGKESELARTWHLHASDLDLVVLVESAKVPDEFDAAAVALGISREQVQQDMAKVFTVADDAVILDAPGYQSLARVLARAFSQAANGKGKERHSTGQPFEAQPMQALIELYGPGFALGQAAKKAQEAQRLEHTAAVRELLGAINYMAGAVIAMERKQSHA